MPDEFRDFFSNYGEVKEQQIMRDHSTGRSRGFGFITFESDQSVDDLLAKGNRLDFSGTQVSARAILLKKLVCAMLTGQWQYLVLLSVCERL